MKQPETKPCVLIVDADPSTQKASVEAVVAAGFEAIPLNDAQALFRTMDLKFQKVRPSFLMIDVSLPMMSGFELARRFTAQYERLKIPLFLTSKYDSNEDRLEAGTVGAQSLIVKPVSPAAFKQAVEKVRMRELKGEIGNMAFDGGKI